MPGSSGGEELENELEYTGPETVLSWAHGEELYAYGNRDWAKPRLHVKKKGTVTWCTKVGSVRDLMG